MGVCVCVCGGGGGGGVEKGKEVDLSTDMLDQIHCYSSNGCCLFITKVQKEKTCPE